MALFFVIMALVAAFGILCVLAYGVFRNDFHDPL
jgi:hypothetical protein